ncbi:MAG: hypothetical protein U0359_08180 [Byssovorax sp.]
MATYTIKPGDYVAKIAFLHGFRSYQTIYDDPANADFRSKRPNPDVLFPGETLIIPDKQDHDEAADTGKKHTFFARPRTPVKLRLIVKGHDFTPLADKRYTLTLGRETIGEDGKARTGKDGLIEHDIDPSITQARLKVFLDDSDPDRGPAWKLLIGDLDPITEISGVKGRLNNLGFDCGQVNGTFDDPLRKALAAFREAMSIPAPADDSAVDDPTRDRLQKEHDS